MNLNERRKLADSLKIHTNEDGFISIPNHCQRIKIDVGLSMTAPHLIAWLKKDPSLFVIGIEPVEKNIKVLSKLLETAEHQNIGNRYVLIQAACGSQTSRRRFYVTKDLGQSSFLEPVDFEISEVIEIETFTLDTILYLIPPERFSRIDYIKTDCQGFDLEVLRGASTVLKQTVVVTCEAESKSYFDSTNTRDELAKFLNHQNFININPRGTRSRIASLLARPIMNSPAYQKIIARRQLQTVPGTASIVVLDPTFVNREYEKLVQSGEVTAWQFN